MSWETQKVQLAWVNGTHREVDGLVHPDAPGLAVTPYYTLGDETTGHTVTHIPSGYMLGDSMPCETAKAFCLSIADLTDWTVKMESLTPEMAAEARRRLEECQSST